MNYVIETQHLVFAYSKKPVLNAVSIQIHENQMIGLIGRNGSGKTTFLKLCAGLLEPKQGELKVFSQNPVNNLNVLQELIYSYTNVPHKASLSLEYILKDFAMFYEHFDLEFAHRLLEFFSLDHRMKYSGLSQGMTSVFGFICAISTRARLTLLDEPVVGMDVTVRRKVYEILLRDYMEHPRTIIISSHILSELQDLLSEMIMIDHGEIMLYKSMEELQTMAYRIEGSKADVTAFAKEHPALYEEHRITSSLAIIEAPLDEAVKNSSRQLNLVLSRVDAEELYIYKTNHGKGIDFDCLWENQN